ncbi:probable receptor-like protein kinase At5g20050 [Asparagus officinalis]|uniref:probable receptor-like protein kinase At5g20050 n=1 Tax=Asparagus officinalis TaxID=4686 RepID=UPI00098E7874|nr:probable receptor-like protein kinase At5g20050 [Asparagus officinalis]
MNFSRLPTFTAISVASLLLLLLILFLSLGSSFAFFLTGSHVTTLVFIVILLWLLINHGFFDGPDTLCLRRTWLMAFATSLLTFILLTVVTMLCIRVKPTRTIFFICVGVDLAFVLAISSPVLVKKIIALYRRRTRARLLLRDEEEGHTELEFTYLGRAGGLPKKFRYDELKTATNNFRTPIGRGGSGSVFKGVLGDGLPVAVKRIEGELRGEREFRSEITAIVSAQHVNLVAIIGYCLVRGGHRFLVYELLQNGSLDCWIFPGKREDGSYLSWASRYQVAIDVAKALSYLHHDCRSRVLHLDVKPQNILLDENFRARVSDFGISRTMDRDESRVVTTVRGTRGYLAPEWFSGEGISDKSDVYSFGMVILEILGGRRNFEIFNNGSISEGTWIYFPKIANEKMREGKLMEVVDERLKKDGGINEAQVKVLVYVAIWCIQERAELRPSMELVVSMLKGHTPVDMPPETRMFMVDLVVPSDSMTISVLSRAQSATSGQTDHPSASARSISTSTNLLR